MALAMPQMCCALYLQALGYPRQVGSPSVLFGFRLAHMGDVCLICFLFFCYSEMSP